MALSKLKGQNFRVFTEGAAVPEAVTCNVSISGNMEDASTKDVENNFVTEQMTSKTWQVQVDSYDASVAKLRTLLARIKAGTALSVGWDQTDVDEGSMNRTASNADFARSGQALLTDLSIVANNRQTVNVSEQYLGTGALS